MFDTGKFIAEIKKRPVIYDTNHFQYNEKTAKLNAWREVGQAMFPDAWNHMTVEEQILEDKVLRGKWRNIRDYFIKEYKIQKTTAPGKKKRRRYAYYHNLLFLMPIVHAKQIDQNNKLRKNLAALDIMPAVKTEESEAESVASQDCDGAANSLVDGDSMYDPATPGDMQKPRNDDPAVCEASMTSVDAADDQSMNGTYQRVLTMQENDYDKMFLLSLLPSLRQVPEHQKLKVRIQIQQVLVSAIESTGGKVNS